MEPGHKSRWGLGKRKGMAGMPETWASARAIAQGQSSQREDSNLLAELQRCIRDALPDGGATLDAIAATLGFSERTLQRRLQSVQLNFQQLVERLRFEIGRASCRERVCQYV